MFFADETSEQTFDWHHVTINDIVIDIDKDGYTDGDQTIEQLPDGKIKLTYNTIGRRFLIKNFDTSGYVHITYSQLLNVNGNDITSNYLSLEDPLIGIYTESGNYSLGPGYITGNIKTTNYETGIELPCSSRFDSTNIPITLIIDLYTVNNLRINYQNKTSIDANYWIPFGGTNIVTLESKSFYYFTTKIQNFNK